MSISNAVFYRYHGHHRLSYKFLVFTNSSNELFRISSIEIEVSIVMQLKIKVKSNSITNEERRIKNMEVIKNNLAKDLPIYQGIVPLVRHVLVSYFQV